MSVFIQVDNYIMKSDEIITPTQHAIVKSYYDMTIHSELSHENDKITAHIVDYLGSPSAYNGDIYFDYDGQIVTAKAANGIASIDCSASSGKHTIKTVNTDMRNGEITFSI